MCKKYSQEEVQRIFEDLGLILMSPYVSYKGSVTVLCLCNNVFSTPAGYILSGQKLSCGCNSKAKISHEEAYNRIKKEGLILLSKYKGNKVKSEIQCYCGKIFFCQPASIFEGQTRSCGCLRDNNRQKNLNAIIEQKRKKVLLKAYDKVGEKHLKLTILNFNETKRDVGVYVCLCDCGNIKDIKYDRIGRTSSCGCLRHRKGKDNPRYKYNKESRTSNENVCWIKLIYKRFNYTCQVCQTKNEQMQAHHIYSWIRFPEKRYNIDNGVCLCRPCHKLFHNLYGKKSLSGERDYQEFRANYGV